MWHYSSVFEAVCVVTRRMEFLRSESLFTGYLPTDFPTASQLRSAQGQTSTRTEITRRGKQQSVFRAGPAPRSNPLPFYTPLVTFVYLPLKNGTHLTCLLVRTGMNR